MFQLIPKSFQLFFFLSLALLDKFLNFNLVFGLLLLQLSYFFVVVFLQPEYLLVVELLLLLVLVPELLRMLLHLFPNYVGL